MLKDFIIVFFATFLGFISAISLMNVIAARRVKMQSLKLTQAFRKLHEDFDSPENRTRPDAMA